MKRFLSILLCVILLSTFTAAYAEEDSALQILTYQQNEDSLDILLYAKDNTYFSADNFSVKLGGTELPVNKLSALSSADYGTSWIVVVEPAAYASIEDMVSSLVDSLITRLGENDNLAVLDASTMEMTSFVRDTPTVRGFVKSALEAHGDVPLYDAIHSALSTFRSNDSINPRKCLLVVSGGVDKNSTYTISELRSEIEKSDVTVYTLGITRNVNTYKEAYKDLSSLSRASASGYTFAYDDFPTESGATAARKIQENEKNCYVLTADLSGLTEVSGDTITVELGGMIAKLDGIHIDPPVPHEHVWGDDATCQHARTCTICGEEDPAGEIAPHEYGSDGLCIWCGQPAPAPTGLDWVKENLILCVMALVLLLLLIVLLIVLIKRKKRKQVDMDGESVFLYDSATTPVSKPSNAVGVVTVELINKASGAKFSGDIFDATLKAGRSAALKLEGDGAISREHMEFIWQNGILYVQDANATNGTMVNGREIHGAVPLHQSDVIHAGESDFIVTWRTNR